MIPEYAAANEALPLDAMSSVLADCRYLACENNRIFHLCKGDQIEVIRVLHTLQDYMRALFL